jgi:hypothetical protein
VTQWYVHLNFLGYVSPCFLFQSDRRRLPEIQELTHKPQVGKLSLRGTDEQDVLTSVCAHACTCVRAYRSHGNDDN